MSSMPRSVCIILYIHNTIVTIKWKFANFITAPENLIIYSAILLSKEPFKSLSYLTKIKIPILVISKWYSYNARKIKGSLVYKKKTAL